MYRVLALSILVAIPACADGALAEQLSDEYVTAVCQKASDCQDSFPPEPFGLTFEERWGTSVAMCAEEWKAQRGDIEDAVDDDRLLFDEADARACIDFIRARTCDDQWSPLYVPSPCDTAWVGNVSAGGRCTSSLECEAGSGCAFTSTTEGICVRAGT